MVEPSIVFFEYLLCFFENSDPIQQSYKRAVKFNFIRSDPLDTFQSYTALKLDFWRPGNATLLTAELATKVVQDPDEA